MTRQLPVCSVGFKDSATWLTLIVGRIGTSTVRTVWST
jgi:hypothetical protein